MASPAATSMTTAPAVFVSTDQTTPRYCAVPSAITAGMNTIVSIHNANSTMLTGPANGAARPLNACQTTA